MTKKRLWAGLVAVAALVVIPLGGLTVFTAPMSWAQGIAFWPNPVAPTQDAAYDIGTSTNRFRTIYTSGVAGTGGLRTVQTTPPTCSNNCGTSPSVVGSDYAMRVTTGATGSPASPVTVTFAGTWGAAPACIVQRHTGTDANVVQEATTTTTTIVFVVATAVGNSDVFNIICQPVS